MKKHYKDALYIAAKAAYDSEVVDSQMVDLLIGEDCDFASEVEWIEARITEWLEKAELDKAPAAAPKNDYSASRKKK